MQHHEPRGRSPLGVRSRRAARPLELRFVAAGGVPDREDLDELTVSEEAMECTRCGELVAYQSMSLNKDGYFCAWCAAALTSESWR